MKYYYLTYRITKGPASYSFGGIVMSFKTKLDLRGAGQFIADAMKDKKENTVITGIYEIDKATYECGV